MDKVNIIYRQYFYTTAHHAKGVCMYKIMLTDLPDNNSEVLILLVSILTNKAWLCIL